MAQAEKTTTRGQPLRPRADQVERAQRIADALPVPSTWQNVLREAIDRGLPLIEADMNPAGSAG